MHTPTPTAHGPCALQQPAVSRARPSTAVSLIGIVSGHARAARGDARHAVTSAAPPKTNPFRDASAALHTYTAHDGHRPGLIFTYYFRSGSVGPPERRPNIQTRPNIDSRAPRPRASLFPPAPHATRTARPSKHQASHPPPSQTVSVRPAPRASRHSVSVGSIYVVPRAGLLRPA